MINNPYVYALSLGVYCTAWIFYGSVGRAATPGVGFLPIYLGPTLATALWFVVLRNLGGLILIIRRAAIIATMLLGYFYFRLVGESVNLVSIGLISFAAVAQFAPAILDGIFWKGGSRRGATVGLVLGFAVWAYTLPIPALADTHAGLRWPRW